MTRIEKIFHLQGAMSIIDGLRDGATEDFQSPLFQRLDSSMSHLEEAMEALKDTED